MSTPSTVPKQRILNIPFDIPTETDVDTTPFRASTTGTLVAMNLHIYSTSKKAADIPVAIDLLLFREQVTFPMIDGYISGTSDGDNPGITWFGRIPIDTETGFGFRHYNGSGETIRFLLTLVIEP